AGAAVEDVGAVVPQCAAADPMRTRAEQSGCARQTVVIAGRAKSESSSSDAVIQAAFGLFQGPPHRGSARGGGNTIPGVAGGTEKLALEEGDASGARVEEWVVHLLCGDPSFGLARGSQQLHDRRLRVCCHPCERRDGRWRRSAR